LAHEEEKKKRRGGKREIYPLIRHQMEKKEETPRLEA